MQDESILLDDSELIEFKELLDSGATINEEKFTSKIKQIISLYKKQSGNQCSPILETLLPPSTFQLIFDFVLKFKDDQHEIILITALQKIITNKACTLPFINKVIENGFDNFFDQIFNHFLNDGLEEGTFIAMMKLITKIFLKFPEKSEIFPSETILPLFQKIENNYLTISRICEVYAKLRIIEGRDFIIENSLSLLNKICEENHFKENIHLMEKKTFIFSNINDSKIVKHCLNALSELLVDEVFREQLISENVLSLIIFPFIHSQQIELIARFITNFYQLNNGADDGIGLDVFHALINNICYILLMILNEKERLTQLPSITYQPPNEEALKMCTDAETTAETLFKSYSTTSSPPIGPIFQENKHTQIVSILLEMINEMVLAHDQDLAFLVYHYFIGSHLMCYLTNTNLLPIPLQETFCQIISEIQFRCPELCFSEEIIMLMAQLIECEENEVLPYIRFFFILTQNMSPELKESLVQDLDDYSPTIKDYIHNSNSEELSTMCQSIANKLEWDISE